ncbi:MAG: hypothetical protein ACLFPN_03805, partial [Methanomassiliicoccales archaeon]
MPDLRPGRRHRSLEQEGRELSQTFPLIRATEFQAKVREDYPMGYLEFLETKDREDVTLLDARPSRFY